MLKPGRETDAPTLPLAAAVAICKWGERQCS